MARIISALRNAASTGLVLNPLTNVVQVFLPPIALKCLSMILTSCCCDPPSAQPTESNRKSLAEWTACGESASHVRFAAHSASVQVTKSVLVRAVDGDEAIRTSHKLKNSPRRTRGT